MQVETSTTKSGTTCNDAIHGSQKRPRIQAEIDIMIAVPSARGKGMGKEATVAMALYALQELNVQRIFCKINQDNTASIELFKSIGFVQCDYAECFRQIEMELKLSKSEMINVLLRLAEDRSSVYQKIHCPL